MYKLFILVFLASCMSAPKHLQKAIDKDRPYVAGETRRLWPCIVTATDTVTTTDTIVDIISVQCPDSIAWKTDTLESSVAVPYRVPVYIKVPLSRIRETITHTIRIEDSAKVYVAYSRADAADKKAGRLEDKVKRKNTAIWLLIAALVIMTGYAFRRVLIRIIKPI
jgi:hypothetical protein